jgi:glucose uptake protein GlcU
MFFKLPFNPSDPFVELPPDASTPFCIESTGLTDSANATGVRANTNISTIKNIISLLLFVLGVICVIVIIVAGIQYAVAAGDSNQITRAKNSILYAIVGLVIALLAYTIVNFVIDQFR